LTGTDSYSGYALDEGLRVKGMFFVTDPEWDWTLEQIEWNVVAAYNIDD